VAKNKAKIKGTSDKERERRLRQTVAKNVMEELKKRGGGSDLLLTNGMAREERTDAC